jgi:hypothetical protein
MAGAEIIALVGLFASVSQLVSSGNNARLWISDLSERARREMVILPILDKEASTVLSLARSIQCSYASPANIDCFLQGCITECEALIESVGTWRTNQKVGPEVSWIDKVRMAIAWKKKEEQIKQHLENIDRHKVSLILYLTAHCAQSTTKIADLLEAHLTTGVVSDNHFPMFLNLKPPLLCGVHLADHRRGRRSSPSNRCSVFLAGADNYGNTSRQYFTIL